MKTLGKVLLWMVLAIAVVLVAGWFALYRPDIPYEKLEAKYANAESHFMGAPGAVRARYRDQGNPDGPVLVMVHGYAASLETWEPWAARLGGDYRIITVDLPGHGLTRTPPGYNPSIEGYADYVEAVTEQLGVHSFTLIGNSMGGHTAWVYALKYPNRLDGLVLVDAAGWPPEDETERPAVFKILANPAARAAFGKLEGTAMVRNGLRGAFYPEPDKATDAMVERYVDMARGPGHREILMSLMAKHYDEEAATPKALAMIRVPVLIMHGDSDKLIPVAAGHKFAQSIPDATLIIYEKTGHIPMEQIPDRSAADLKAWLKEKVYPAEAAATASTE